MTSVVTIDDDNIRGTKSYIATESLRDSYFDWSVDVWALGCMVLEMLTGKQVWSSKSSILICSLILTIVTNFQTC